MVSDGVFADVPNSPEQEPDSPVSLHTVPGTMDWGQIQVRPAIGCIGWALGFSNPAARFSQICLWRLNAHIRIFSPWPQLKIQENPFWEEQA